MVGPFDIAWTLLKNWRPSPEEIAEMEAGRQLGMNPDASVFMPQEDEPQGPLLHEDMGEGHDYMHEGSTTDIRPSQRDTARSHQATETGERRWNEHSHRDAKIDEFMRRREGKGRTEPGAAPPVSRSQQQLMTMADLEELLAYQHDPNY